MTSKRWNELYEEALAEIRQESCSPSGSVYDWDDRESAMMIATLQGRREEREKAQLRQAIKLGTELAERDALATLTMKAKQVAELDQRRPRLVWNRDQIAPQQV